MIEGTDDPAYAERLARLQGAWWKRLLQVQAPYGWHARRVCPGRVLDLGCGIGRNLEHLRGRGTGVDHNAESVAIARSRGLDAYLPEGFAERFSEASFDTLLVAHVLEHLSEPDADGLVKTYLRYLRPGGRVICITPQERGYASDETHVRWVGEDGLRAMAGRLGLTTLRTYSFPFPRPAGRLFTYNEFVLVAQAG